MFLKQFYLACLSQASYLIGDKDAGQAMVVDPIRDVDQYLEEAQKEGLAIKHVLLTHVHADFISGHLELAERVGAKIYAGARASLEFPFTPLDESFCLELGPSVLVKILETPGHTPESVSILLYDLAQNSKLPNAVLTGDTLFVGDVGRPDLFGLDGPDKNKLAGALYESLLEKLLQLPEETIVYPAHGSGSLCGKNLGRENLSTIGAEKATNWALQPMRKAEFVFQLTNDLPPAPPYFAFDASQNKKVRPALDTLLPEVLKKLDFPDLENLEGVQLLDCREPEEFCRKHIKGSINVGLSGKFATWAGSVLEPQKPIVIICRQGRQKEAAVRLMRIGFDRILGYLPFAENEAGESTNLPQESLVPARRLEAATLVSLLSGANPPFVLDVRQEGEFKQASISESLNIPLTRLSQSLGALPRDRQIVVVCAGGFRSSIAASLLRKNGLPEVSDLIGGMSAWQKAAAAPNPVLNAILDTISHITS